MHPVNMSATIFLQHFITDLHTKEKRYKSFKNCHYGENNEKLNKQSKRLNRKVGPGGNGVRGGERHQKTSRVSKTE